VVPYFLPQHKLAVFFSPKVAGTSVRLFLLELENGFPFPTFQAQGEVKQIDGIIRNRPFREVRTNRKDIRGWEKVAIIRDPVKRLLSAYSNRVLHYRELSEDTNGPALAKVGLEPDPDVATFFGNFLAYRRVAGTIQRHFAPQSRFLGRSADYFDRVYRFEDLAPFEADMRARFGGQAAMPRSQTGGTKQRFEALDDETQINVVDAASRCRVFDWAPDYAEPYADQLKEVRRRNDRGQSEVWDAA